MPVRIRLGLEFWGYHPQRSSTLREVRDGIGEGSLGLCYVRRIAFSNSGVTAVHAMAYPLGAVSHAPHGMVNGLLLPHVMEYNLPVGTKELADVAKALGEKIEDLSPKEAARKAIAEVNEIIRSIGLPTRMRDLGAKEKDLRPMAEATMLVTRLLRSNPRRVSVDTIEEIYKHAL